MLKVGGENVAAAEIEGFLAEHPAVAEVQVVAAPDQRYIEVPCAFVVLRSGARLEYDELLAYCHGRIATYKIPRYLRLVTEWPMSGTKIQKFRLREQIARELDEAGIRSAPKIAAPAVAGGGRVSDNSG
jgi:fatty-acyl-CoA synthase